MTDRHVLAVLFVLPFIAAIANGTNPTHVAATVATVAGCGWLTVTLWAEHRRTRCQRMAAAVTHRRGNR